MNSPKRTLSAILGHASSRAQSATRATTPRVGAGFADLVRVSARPQKRRSMVGLWGRGINKLLMSSHGRF
jgi:hypothetical protein